MGLFDFLKKDPSQKWVRDEALQIEVDLDKHRLCGARLGGPLDALAQFGPAEDRKKAKDEVFCYFSRGVEFGGTNGLLEYFSTYFIDPLDEGYAAYAGSFRHGGRAIALDARTTETEFRARFGEPFWRDEDEDEILLFYEFGDEEWQVEFTKRQTLQLLLVSSPPLMASERTRRLYGVDKPYPF